MKAPVDSAIPRDQIQREAQAWLRRMTSGTATEQDLQAFERWRAASPLHLKALAEAQRWWETLGPAFNQLRAQNGPLAASLREERRPAWGRRAFLGGAVGMTAAAAAAVVVTYPSLNVWLTMGEWQADYRTGVGEQRQIALTEHVSVDMNTLTAISRQNVNGRMAGIELVSGEAAFDLSVAPARGFSVRAGVGRSVATQTGHFEVRHIDELTCVTCVQGALRVEHPQGARDLASGERTVYGANSLSAIAQVDPAAVSAWRSGILVFNKTPLTQVIDEINRYRPGHVVLLNGDVKGREVSGRFPIQSLDAVLWQIQHTYALNARKLPGGLLLLA